MKKFFLLVAVGAVAISCNNPGNTKTVNGINTVFTDSVFNFCFIQSFGT